MLVFGTYKNINQFRFFFWNLTRHISTVSVKWCGFISSLSILKKIDNWKSKSVHINYKFWLLMSNSQNFVKDIPIRTLFYSFISYHRDQHDERREWSKFLILLERIRSTFLLHCWPKLLQKWNVLFLLFSFFLFFLLNASQNFWLKIYVTANMELNTRIS